MIPKKFTILFRGLIFLAVFIFSLSELYRIETLELKQVIAIIDDLGQPWDRIRGGQQEYFRKVTCTYRFQGEDYPYKREVSFRTKGEADEYYEEYFILWVYDDKPSEVTSITGKSILVSGRPFFIVLALLSFSLLFYQYRIFSRMHKKSRTNPA